MQEIIPSLLSWYAVNGRHDLPWRQTRDPYRVLVSELMLQQTQVARVIPKYNAFVAAFPTLQTLAHADRREVLQLWQGLGYNSRAVRLHTLAKMLVEQGKNLPDDYESLLKLPGIGPYTAGAVVIFSHNKVAPSVDVNVERVLKRVFYGPKEFFNKQQLELLGVNLLTNSGKPHDWQSMLMDFGSNICTAKNPKCDECLINLSCKSKGVRPDELRTTPKQSKFLGSNRWWRGQILKVLLQGPVKEQHLLYQIKETPTTEEQDVYSTALEGMMKEGLVKKEGDFYKLG